MIPLYDDPATLVSEVRENLTIGHPVTEAMLLLATASLNSGHTDLETIDALHIIHGGGPRSGWLYAAAVVRYAEQEAAR